MTATQDAPTDRMAGPASLALVRVFIWETGDYAASLGRHLQAAGHPFVMRRRDQLPQAFAQSCGQCCGQSGRGGQIFELFTLPIDLGAVLDALHLEETERDLETGLDLSELPSLLLRRKRRPADPGNPEREFRRVLQHFPTWRPDADFTPTSEREPSHRDATLRAPFVPDHDDDHDTIDFTGGYRARCR